MAYAESKGWTDATGKFVRAHIEEFTELMAAVTRVLAEFIDSARAQPSPREPPRSSDRLSLICSASPWPARPRRPDSLHSTMQAPRVGRA